MKTLIIFLLFIPFLLFGQEAIEGDSDILFLWRCESATTEKPVKTVTLTNVEIVTEASNVDTYGLKAYVLDGIASIPVDTAANDIIDFDNGRIGFYIKAPTWTTNSYIFKIEADASNIIYVGIYNATRIRYTYEGNTDFKTLTPSTALTPTSWNFLEFAWNTTIDTMVCYFNGVVAADGELADITTMAVGKKPTTIKFGSQSQDSDFYFDQIMISSDWQKDLYALRDDALLADDSNQYNKYPGYNKY